MIHFAIGTRAQLIKTAPVMKRLRERGISYRYIDLGQHPGTTAKLRGCFGLPEPDVSLGLSSSSNVTSLAEAMRWSFSMVRRMARCKNNLFETLYGCRNGVCVIHGDTLSTLYGLLLSKKAGLATCHLESGLRSGHLLNPFPEEVIRLICMRFANHLVAATDCAYDNLVRMGYEMKSLRIPGNTGSEAVQMVLGDEASGVNAKDRTYALVSIHRFETIMSCRSMKALADFISTLSADISIEFVVHQPTMRSLKRFDLIGPLRDAGVRLTPPLDYPSFLRLILNAEFVITDGGSIQEECSYLGIPCLLYRKHTERFEGLGENVVLSELKSPRLWSFIHHYSDHRRPLVLSEVRPSDVMVDRLVFLGYAGD